MSDSAEQVNKGEEEPGWAPDPDDEWGLAVLETAGRQIKKWRELRKMRAVQFGKLVNYSEDMIYKIERGERIPAKLDFYDRADAVLEAGGMIAELKVNVQKVRYPKAVRDLGKLEGKAVEIGVYECNSINGLLQTQEHAEVLLRSWRPPRTAKDVERLLAARMDRKSVFERDPAPSMHFVLEEAILQRQVGGTMAWKRQLEHLLEVGRLDFVTLQVMLTNSDPHPGLAGRMELFKFADGSGVGRADGLFNGRPASEPKQLRVIELQYGTLRALALSPRETLAHIEQLLGET
ncbi:MULTISPECIES: helix-turn-helix transcriptional regulator [unclassified Streptomyces]|uniref:helix-turn-helix domain-containing protein n=1 Tax=unclassified Streptomyces TaxID=2593676 RepID=UPI000DDB7D66|nr:MULTISPECIES: helix-turn-helix transcriptional regulator [unclassified Streptomyces]QZZ29594.1 helix-turn-helix transcriptional regulator [Streptomyces sp. ST1015]